MNLVIHARDEFNSFTSKSLTKINNYIDQLQNMMMSC